MSNNIISVYHTTKDGNGEKIINSGWNIPRKINIGQVYGRGLYFWELIEDAHKYGQLVYGDRNYEIIQEEIPLIEGNFLLYNHSKRMGSDHDMISKGLLKRGINCLIISRAYMDKSTMEAKGKAFVWLVDIDVEYKTIHL
jgi:hypothetical protein